MPAPNKQRGYRIRNASRRTETREEIVEDAEDSGLPLELDVERAPDGNGGGDGEDEDGDPLELLPPVVPADWGTLLLVFQRPGDVVVGNVDVAGDDIGLECL